MLDRSLSLLTGRVLLHTTSRLTLPPLCSAPAAASCFPLTASCRRRPRQLQLPASIASLWSPASASGPAPTPHHHHAVRHIATASAFPRSSSPLPDLSLQVQENLLGSSPTYLRHSLEALASWDLFTAAGVTFENRQEAVQSLQAGEPVMLVREPWNPFDPQAVAVYTLEGRSLGFVPRDENSGYQLYELLLGHVDYVGCEPHTHNWGVRIMAQPNLMSAYTSAFPPQLLPPAPAPAPAPAAAAPQPKTRGRKSTKSAQAAEAAEAAAGADPAVAAAAGASPPPVCCWPEGLSAAVGVPRWQQLVEEALGRSRGACEVTGAAAAVTPLELVPEWRFNEGSKTIELQGLSLVCREVALARRALDLTPGSEEQRVAIETLVLVNGWKNLPCPDMFPEEEHLEAMRRLRQRVLEEGWALDLGGN